MTTSTEINQYQELLADSNASALVFTEYLQPVAEAVDPEEKGKAVIFPPTYAPEKKGDQSGYVIDALKDGRQVCQMASFADQANRMEPIFKAHPYNELIPQVLIKVKPEKSKETEIQDDWPTVNLLDAGHRAADAIVRFSNLANQMAQGFLSWERGDASFLAKTAPTSLIFGAWDSRHTQAKTPRIISSIIRAYDVEKVHRAAQYNPAINYSEEGIFEQAYLDTPIKSEKLGAKFGFTHVPAPRSLGGILVHGEIRREAILNLVALRSIDIFINLFETKISLRGLRAWTSHRANPHPLVIRR